MSEFDTSTLTDEERRAIAVQYLAEQKPGFMPLDLFSQIARISVLATVEVVPIRVTEGGKTQVLLTQRSAEDPWWPSEWHVPGATIVASDPAEHPFDLRAPLGRVLNADGELRAGVKALHDPIPVQTEFRPSTGRGAELSVVHFVQVEGEPTVGQFVDMDSFPDSAPGPVIEHHQRFIPDAVEAFHRFRAIGALPLNS